MGFWTVKMAALCALQTKTVNSTKAMGNTPLEMLNTKSTAIPPKQVDKTMPKEEYPLMF